MNKINPAPKIPPTNKSALDQIAALLKEGQTFCLSGHQNPDGDVIGSSLAMASLIRRLDSKKRVDLLNAGHPPRNVSFLPGADQVKSVQKVDGKYDVLIVFECSGADRMGNIIDFGTQVGSVINIDHHLHNPNFGHVNFVEPHTSSTAELIYKIFEHMEMPLTVDEATCLYTGMVSDTGWFRYGNTISQTHEIAAKLLAAGVPVASLSERIYLSKSEVGVRLLAWCLTNLKLSHGRKVAMMSLPRKVFVEMGASPDDIDEIVNAGLSIASVQISAFLKEKDNPPAIKISLRSKGDMDINQVARKFGGGGHRNASGCAIEMDLASAEQAILREIDRIV